MQPGADAVRKACPGAAVKTARQLCRAETAVFETAAAGGRVTIACTQEERRFREIALDGGHPAALTFVNIRETAGWSSEGGKAQAKMAALIAAAEFAMPETPLVSFDSGGTVLIYGRDDTAIEAGRQLQDQLDVTVMITGASALQQPRRADFPVARGRIASARGHLGAFELTINGFARPAPSSRGTLVFGDGQDSAASSCDIILDLSGGAPLFTAHDLRDGYLRADPADPLAVQRAVFKAAGLTGSFDKPRYIQFRAELCAHSRSKKTGCTRCLDLCPAGAITPDGDHVAVDPYICGGCGACAAACPTGAASYALPPVDALLGRLRALLTAYRAAGGLHPVLLLHDSGHGADLIGAAAHYGDGLPAHVLPLALNEVTQAGPELFAAAFSYGAAAVRVLLRARPRHDISGLAKTLAITASLTTALGYGAGAADIIAADDPDELARALAAAPVSGGSQAPSSFQPVGGKRDVMVLALREMHRAAPQPADRVTLPEGAPFGIVSIDTPGCTLCLACVSVCPVSALGDNPDKPMLTFDASLCVQCRLCAATCPEKVITLKPVIDFTSFGKAPVILKQEEPFNCIRCGAAFGTEASVERVAAKLGSHWMFTGANAHRLDTIRMCEPCRVTAMANESFDPYAAPERPKPRTTDDYLREREMLEAERAKFARDKPH